jgi:hypothetical protein
MDPDDIKLNSVNWEHGMLLTPEHFLRQERYFDSAILWMLRYGGPTFGLVGGGPRLAEAERGAVRHDPVVTVDEDEEQVSISVTQCRALTPGGVIVEIDPDHAIHRGFPKTELEGVSESGIYIITDPREKEAAEGALDDANPQMKTERKPGYRLALSVHADSVSYAVAVGRLKRQDHGAGFEKDGQFIPACTSMVSYSELTASWRDLVDRTNSLFERYTALHRAMQEYVDLFKERGIETELDLDTLQFVGRMVVALQTGLYGMLDPVQPPENFFSHMRQFFHSASVYLDLSPPVKQYFDQLIETGETEYITLIEQQKQLLQIRRRWEVHEDLGVEVRKSRQNLSVLHRLELALEGKYIDFRISPTLEAMNFIFDRGGRVLYKIAAKPNRMQGYGEELTIHFAQLRLEGRDKYRLILCGEHDATFEPGTKITAEIKINEGAGFHREPIMISCESKSTDQRNFEFDFEAPDVPTITDLRVSIPAHNPIRTGLLFIRHRFYASQGDEPRGRERDPEPPARERREPPPPRGEPSPGDSPRERRFRRVGGAATEAPRGGSSDPAPWETSGREPEPADRGNETRVRDDRGDDSDEPPRPRRRRRLE